MLAWASPFERYAAMERAHLLGIALAAGAVLACLALAEIELERRWMADEDGRGRAVSICLLGALSLYGALFPVLVAGRDVDFTSGYDRYTLHASPARVALLRLCFSMACGKPSAVPG